MMKNDTVRRHTAVEVKIFDTPGKLIIVLPAISLISERQGSAVLLIDHLNLYTPLCAECCGSIPIIPWLQRWLLDMIKVVH